MLLRVLGGGGYLTCHPSSAGGLGKQTHPSLQPRRRVHLMNEASRKWDERNVRARLKRDNDDESHFSPSSPFVCRHRCPETQHICFWVLASAHGTIRFVINCECSDRTMSHSCIQNRLHLLKEKYDLKKFTNSFFLNLISFSLGNTLSWQDLHVRERRLKKLVSHVWCSKIRTCGIQAFCNSRSLNVLPIFFYLEVQEN